MIRYVTVRVKMSETSKRNLEVVAWEVPVLMAVHEGKCKVLDGEKLVARDPPEVGYEFDRLARRYKEPRTEDGAVQSTPYVALIYGTGSIGVGRLAEAIRAHTVTDMVDPLSLDPSQDDGVQDLQHQTSFAVMSGLAEEATPVDV
jgi:hypothetical protein